MFRYLVIAYLLLCSGWAMLPAMGAGYYHDADLDGDVSHDDCAHLQACCLSSEATCVFVHDRMGDGQVTGSDLGMFAGCYTTNGVAPGAECVRAARPFFDVNGDGFGDLFDFYGLADCFNSNGLLCLFVYDVDADADVDLDDYAVFQVALDAGGPGVALPVTDGCSRFGNPFMWTGQRYNPATGLYEFLFRPYSPAVGRWQQRDPMGPLNPGGGEPCCCCGDVPLFHVRSPLVGAGDEYLDAMNLYEYAGSCPIVFIDPTGREYTLSNLTLAQGIEALLLGAIGSTVGLTLAADQQLQWGVMGLDADLWDLFVDATEAFMVGSFMAAEALYTAVEQAAGRARPIPIARSRGMCEFYLAWCEWGNGRPPGDKGRGWKRNAPCLQCYSTCKSTGRWPLTVCPIGGYPKHRWPGPNDPWEPAWPTPGEY